MQLCNAPERTAQGLDETPAAGFESQLDPAIEEQRAGPCPISGIVKDQGSWGGGWRAPEGRGRNASELETAQRRGGGRGSPGSGIFERAGTQGNGVPICPSPAPRPQAPVGQVCLGWTTRAWWEPCPESSRLYLGPGRESRAAQGRGRGSQRGHLRVDTQIDGLCNSESPPPPPT